MLRIAVPDLISPSYLPAEAIVTLGFLAKEGVRAELELIHLWKPHTPRCVMDRLILSLDPLTRRSPPSPAGKAAKLLCAQSQGLYWFLVMRSDIGAKRGDLNCVKGRRIGAAPWVGLALRQLLADGGVDMQRDDVQLVTVPGSVGPRINIGVVAANALRERTIDGSRRWNGGRNCSPFRRRHIGRRRTTWRRAQKRSITPWRRSQPQIGCCAIGPGKVPRRFAPFPQHTKLYAKSRSLLRKWPQLCSRERVGTLLRWSAVISRTTGRKFPRSSSPA